MRHSLAFDSLTREVHDEHDEQRQAAVNDAREHDRVVDLRGGHSVLGVHAWQELERVLRESGNYVNECGGGVS